MSSAGSELIDDSTVRQPATPTPARRSWLAPVLRWGVGLALLAYLWRKDMLSFAVLRRLGDNWPWLAAGLALAPLQPWLGACRWRALLGAAGVEIGRGEAFRLTLTGTFFNLFVPGATGGDVARVGILGRDRGRWSAAVFSVLLDRCLGVPPLLLLVALACFMERDFVDGSPLYSWLRPAALLGLGLSAAGLAVLPLGGRRLERRFGAWDGKTGWRGAGGRLARLAGRYGGAWEALARGLGHGLAAHVGTVLSCICFGVAAGAAGMAWPRYFLTVPAGLFVNAIPLSPGGVGQGEMAFSRLFAAAAPDAPAMGEAGVAIMLCLRLGWCLCGLAGGALYMAGRHRLARSTVKAL